MLRIKVFQGGTERIYITDSFKEGHYDLTYRRKDKSKRSCQFAVSVETFYSYCNTLEKNVYLIKTEAKRLMIEGELENDE